MWKFVWGLEVSRRLKLIEPPPAPDDEGRDDPWDVRHFKSTDIVLSQFIYIKQFIAKIAVDWVAVPFRIWEAPGLSLGPVDLIPGQVA
jgi:hypothetical protein